MLVSDVFYGHSLITDEMVLILVLVDVGLGPDCGDTIVDGDDLS